MAAAAELDAGEYGLANIMVGGLDKGGGIAAEKFANAPGKTTDGELAVRAGLEVGQGIAQAALARNKIDAQQLRAVERVSDGMTGFVERGELRIVGDVLALPLGRH
jgi:hypothetical protein